MLGLRLLASAALAAVLSLVLGRRLLRLRPSGAAVLGGVCAGLALGPFVLGQLAPDQYQRWIVGGTEAEARAEAAAATMERELDALAGTGVSAVAVTERRVVLEREAEAWREQAAFERALHRVVPAGAGLAAGLLVCSGRTRPPRIRASGARWLEGMIAGALTLLPVAVAVRLATGADIATACTIGAVVSAGTMSAHAPRSRAVGVGMVIVSAAVLSVTVSPWLIGVPVIIAARWLIGGGIDAPRVSTPRVLWRWIARWVLAPSVPALLLPSAAATPDTAGLVLIAAAALLAGDAHLVGGVIAVRATDRGARARTPISAWLAVFARDTPTMSLAWLAAVMATDVWDPASPTGSALVLAVATHALACEASLPSAARMLRSMRRGV